MSKKLILIILGILVLLALGYISYTRWAESREKVDLWALVPDDAVFVVETEKHMEFVEKLRETDFWGNLSNTHYFRRFQENIALIDSFSSGRNPLERFLTDKTILTSVHVVSKTDFDMVYYVPVNTVQEHRIVRKLVENLTKDGGFRNEAREYQGVPITDIINETNGESLSYFSYHNNLVISSTPVLVESIIRKINRKQLVSPAKEFTKTNYLLQDDVYAQVFINYRNLPQFMGLFFKDNVYPELEFFSTLCRNAMLECKLQEGRIFLNGFSNPENVNESLFSALKGQSPKPLLVRNFIPNRTALLLHFGVDKTMSLRQSGSGRKQVQPLPEQLSGLTDSLAGMFSREVALCYLEAYNINTSPEKIVFAFAENPVKATALVAQLSAAAPAEDQHGDERYGSHTIRLVPVADLPVHLFGPAFKGFEQCYVSQAGNYLIFSQEIAGLKTVLADIDAENVWGKSAGQKAFLEDSQHEANFSVFVNSVNAWYILNRYMTEENREGLLRNEVMLKRFNLFSMQFSRVEEQYYTSILLRHLGAGSSGKKKEAITVANTIKLGRKAVTEPFPARNPSDKSLEVLVQDSAHVLYNISSSGRITWSDTLGSRISGRIFQAEFGTDKKPKYLFATRNRIHALDAKGNYVVNFPFNLSDTTDIQHLAVLDFGKNNDYRLLVDDNMGNLLMFDTRGNILPGWNPRRLDYRLATEPQYFRVNGRDVVLVILENGYIYALDEDGDTYPGFPISVRSAVSSGAFAKTGANFNKTEFTVVTQQGELVVFNLNGYFVSRKQLLRSGRNARFELLPDQNGKSFVVARQDLGKVSLYDQDLTLLLERNFVTSSPKIIQYFHFGGDKRIYAITETGPQKTYFYDIKARLIGKQPIESNAGVVLHYREVSNQYEVYNTYRNEVRRIILQME